MGAVYKATHVTFEELRAIKVMNPELLGDALFVKRFKQEAVIARKLDHPNAVRVDDIDESEDGLPFMVMEYIEGRSLKDLIEREGPLPASRVCSIIKQVASALNAAHRLGMVHRDIKPANIVLIQTPAGEQAKVLDFGIAKIKESRSGDSGMTLTGTGIVIGTPQYMSPEQALGKRGDQLDGRSDIYSLGVVMYQMLAGELPFKTDTTMQLLLAHINTPPRPLLEAKPGLNIPPALARVTMKCLEKDPNLRPQTGEALIQELTAAESGLAEGGSTSGESSADYGATMIATPAALGRMPETYAGQTTQAAPTLSRVSSAATATSTSVEAPPVIAIPPAMARGSRWPLAVVVALIVIALGGGAVWGGFHFGYFSRHLPVAKAEMPAQTTAKASQPAAVPPPVTSSSSVAGPAAESTLQTPSPEFQPAQAAAAETKPDAVKTSAAKNLAMKGSNLSKTHPAQQLHEAVTAPETSGRPSGRQEVARAAPAPSNPSLATVIVTTAPGAQIYIDGKPAGTAGANGQLTVQNLAAGVHSLRASLSGFNDIDSNFNLPPGGTGFLNAKWGASQATVTPPSGAANQSELKSASNTQAASPVVAASFPVEYLHRLGSSKGLLVIEGQTVRYQPSNGKDAFTSPLTGIRWGSNGGNDFYIRLADNKTVKFRSGSSTAILSALHRAATGP